MTEVARSEYLIEPLSPRHNRAVFSCGIVALDQYLQRQARQDVARNLAAVNILTPDGETVAGFYTLSAQSIFADDLSPVYAAKLPRYPLPVTLLGRMAVEESLRGRGLGRLILMYALKTAYNGSRQVASWAVVVDAKQGARDFYLSRHFISLSPDSSRLFLPMKSIEPLVQLMSS